MIKSPFTSVSIPDIALHEMILHFFKINAEKKALVSVLNTFIHQNGRLTDRDNIYNRLKTYYMQSLLVLRE